MGSGIFLGESRKMTIRIAVSAAALLGLAACGGGDGGIGGPAATFGALANETSDRLDGTGVFITAAPVGTGNPTYSGVMFVAEDLDPAGGTSSSGYLGDIDITADFAGGTISGTADGFFDTVINTVTGKPTGFNTGPNPDGTVVSAGVGFTATGINASPSFNPDFTGTIDGNALTGTGTGLVRGPNGEQITIFEDDIACVVCDFQFGGTDGDVFIFAN